MKNMKEIRWHGRGGQGAKAFPEYGPERMGAPVAAFDRIADAEITIHSPVIAPNAVVILDETLIDSIDVCKGLSEKEGVLIVNTAYPKEEIQKKISWKGKIVVIDASKIAQETIGKPIPNTPMMGALVAATGIMDITHLIEDTKHKLEKKFRTKPEIIEGNLKAIRMAYEEVKKQ
jgi:pyruvate ferredoxin oxidoreductase gamma subunit